MLSVIITVYCYKCFYYYVIINAFILDNEINKVHQGVWSKTKGICQLTQKLC